jgi:hypothetical protein
MEVYMMYHIIKVLLQGMIFHAAWILHEATTTLYSCKNVAIFKTNFQNLQNITGIKMTL